MRILILGTGALGCLFAGKLSAHAEVWMLGTWAAGLEALQRDGIQIHEADGMLQARVPVAGAPDGVPAADIALLLVKSYQTERAAAWAARCLAEDGIALTLQNGLDNHGRLSAAVGAGRSAAGVTFEAATLLGPGRVRHAGGGPTHIGITSGTAGRLHAFAAVLRRAGFVARLTENIDGVLWGKAVVNAAINPLTALWRIPNGELLAGDDRRGLLACLAGEAASVAAARGVTLPFVDPVARVAEVCRATAANHSSMFQDVERGRMTEVDSINGVIVAESGRLGLPAPANEIVWKLVRGLRAASAA